MPAVACGIDWAQDHRDVAVVDEAGTVVAALRINNDAAGLSQLLALLVEHDSADDALPVAIETSQGLLVAGLRAAGRTVYSINPMAVSRYRDRYRASRAKSDAFDAMVLANILRTDAEAHRPLPADSLQVRALRVLTRVRGATWRIGWSSSLGESCGRGSGKVMSGRPSAVPVALGQGGLFDTGDHGPVAALKHRPSRHP